jgi:uncharacterized protein YbaR (Trm112 family)
VAARNPDSDCSLGTECQWACPLDAQTLNSVQRKRGFSDRLLALPQKKRWHPVMLPDDYLRKMKRDLSEVEAQVESKTRYEPDPDAPPPADDLPSP